MQYDTLFVIRINVKCAELNDQVPVVLLIQFFSLFFFSKMLTNYCKKILLYQNVTNIQKIHS